MSIQKFFHRLVTYGITPLERPTPDKTVKPKPTTPPTNQKTNSDDIEFTKGQAIPYRNDKETGERVIILQDKTTTAATLTDFEIGKFKNHHTLKYDPLRAVEIKKRFLAGDSIAECTAYFKRIQKKGCGKSIIERHYSIFNEQAALSPSGV